MPEIDKRNLLDEEVFSYHASKQKKVFIHWHGRQVKVLKGSEAEHFIAKISGLAHKEAQLLMAKETGNFKRGNEKQRGETGT